MITFGIRGIIEVDETVEVTGEPLTVHSQDVALLLRRCFNQSKLYVQIDDMWVEVMQ